MVWNRDGRGRKVAITGAAGFIGSRLLSILVSAGIRCCGLDNLSSGCARPDGHDDLEFHVEDVRVSERVLAIFDAFRPDVIVHLAAIHHIPTCERNPSEALEVNVVGFQNVLDVGERVGCSKIVLASSGAVYDSCEGPLNENRTPVKARDIYSLSKIANEHQLSFWHQRTGATAVVARLFNTIGKNDPNAHLIPDILRQLDSNRGAVTVKLGNLKPRRDYIYVDDTAEALARMVQADHLSGFECFNVGTGVEYDVQTLVENIAKLKGLAVDVEVDSSRVRKVDRLSQVADVRKAISRLGWRPEYSLQDALRLTLGLDKK
jgi:nucleoside-diphosphate-sugar epimerase